MSLLSILKHTKGTMYSRCEIYVVKHKKANGRLFYLSFEYQLVILLL